MKSRGKAPGMVHDSREMMPKGKHMMTAKDMDKHKKKIGKHK